MLGAVSIFVLSPLFLSHPHTNRHTLFRYSLSLCYVCVERVCVYIWLVLRDRCRLIAVCSRCGVNEEFNFFFSFSFLSSSWRGGSVCFGRHRTQRSNPNHPHVDPPPQQTHHQGRASDWLGARRLLTPHYTTRLSPIRHTAKEPAASFSRCAG